MITDEELEQLPEHPELAFLEFEKILRNRLNEEEANAPSGHQFYPRRGEYVTRVLAAAREYEIDALHDWDVSPNISTVDIFRNFLNDVDHYTTKLRIRNASRNRRNSVGLDGNTKTKIHHYVEQIRIIIAAAELPDAKRESLYEKLSRFALEVDKARTSLDAGMSVYIAICDGIGQGFKKLDPARRWIDSIAGLMGRAKDAEDSLRPALPRAVERKQLEAPRNQPTQPASTGPDLDDEIPF